jgi:hypothetical protein
MLPAFAAIATALSLGAGAFAAGAPPVPKGEKVASQVEGDLNRDGAADLVRITTNDNFEAKVTVFMRLQGKDLNGKCCMDGYDTVDTLQVDLTPHGPPTASIKNGVLVIESTTGGSSVRTTSVYRYRLEDGMRLIGLAAQREAPAASIKMSWNLLTGARIVRYGKRDARGVAWEPEAKSVVKVPPMTMSTTTPPDELLDELVQKRKP